MAKDRSVARRSDSRISPSASRVGTASGDSVPSERDGVFHAAAPHDAAGSGSSAMPLGQEDQLFVEEVGVHWVRARWSVTPKTLDRAASAMGRDAYHSSRVLRIFQIEQDDSGPRSKSLTEEIPVPLQVSEWFIHLPSVGDAWMVEVGMLFGQGRFFSLLHSAPMVLNGTRTSLMKPPQILGSERFLDSLEASDPPPLKVQGKFVMSGVTRPGSQAFIDDQPVTVCPQTGKFDWELPLANGRIVVPMNVSDCGKVQRALVAIDLNFHLLEPEPGPEY